MTQSIKYLPCMLKTLSLITKRRGERRRSKEGRRKKEGRKAGERRKDEMREEKGEK